MVRWKELKVDSKFKNHNLKNTIYGPRNKGLVNFNAQIENIEKQNEFLKMYKDITVSTLSWQRHQEQSYMAHSCC